MKVARETDWRTKPLPEAHEVISRTRVFSREEMRQIQMGCLPRAVEDEWFVYGKDDRLHFRRSWKGHCVYIVEFVQEGEVGRMVKALVNRDPSRHEGTGDERNAQLISHLIDLLLLRRPGTPYPAEGNSALEALRLGSLVGRAAMGIYPDLIGEEDEDGEDQDRVGGKPG